MEVNRLETVKANQLFWSMLQSAHNQGRGSPLLLKEYVLIGIDPGETTGFAYRLPWEDGFVVHLQQLVTKDIPSGIDALAEAWPISKWPCHVVLEDYRVYGYKADQHKWAGLHTPKLIGAMELWLYQNGHLHHEQMAIEGKQFCTDENLKLWSLYEAGLKHARDASRHLIQQAFFGIPK